MPLMASTETLVSKAPLVTLPSTIFMSSMVEPLVPNMKHRRAM